MKTISRRALLKSSLLAPAAVATAQGVSPVHSAISAVRDEVSGPLTAPVESRLAHARSRTRAPPARFRLALSFRPRRRSREGLWVRHRSAQATSRRPETSCLPARLPSTTATGAISICRMTGPSNCLSERSRTGEQGLLSARPQLPGDQRRLVSPRLRSARRRRGKRITLEFDGAYRETMVVFNGFYIGRHSGGYDPFSFDVTDFRQSRRSATSCWCAWMQRRAMAGSTRARESIGMCGW